MGNACFYEIYKADQADAWIIAHKYTKEQVKLPRAPLSHGWRVSADVAGEARILMPDGILKAVDDFFEYSLWKVTESWALTKCQVRKKGEDVGPTLVNFMEEHTVIKVRIVCGEMRTQADLMCGVFKRGHGGFKCW